MTSMLVLLFLCAAGGFLAPSCSSDNNPNPSPTGYFPPATTPTMTPTSLCVPLVCTPTQTLTPATTPTSSPTPVKTPSTGPAVYVYNGDITTAQWYQSFLGANGYPTTVVPIAAASGVTFSNYSFILIGYDTYATSGPWSGGYVLPDQIFNSGKPIVGIGSGGGGFFDAVGLTTLGYASSAENASNGIIDVANASNPIWSFPNTIPITKPVTVFNTNIYAIDQANASAPGLTDIGRDDSFPGESLLISQTSGGHNYLLWGYLGPVVDLTPTGKNLFLNAMSYIY